MNNSPTALSAALTGTGVEFPGRSKTAILSDSGTLCGSQFEAVPKSPPAGFFQCISELVAVTLRVTWKPALRADCSGPELRLVRACADTLRPRLYLPGGRLRLDGSVSLPGINPVFKSIMCLNTSPPGPISTIPAVPRPE